MPEFMFLLVILLPALSGLLVYVLPFKKEKVWHWFLEIMMILTSVLVWMIILNRPDGVFTLVRFTGDLAIQFRIDGLSMVFSGLVASLWPLATLYSFEYMTKEERRESFFMFYSMTYGVTLGISLSANLLTMYVFYEMLTLVTFPLVMHTLKREAILASRKYLYYSLGGAAFAFIGLVFILTFGSTSDFIFGGVLDAAKIGEKAQVLRLIYVFAFMGFGVKAAIWPFNSWLPQAGVAPTPVTALLHAVAVVKAGAFAIIRLTYYSYGPEFLRGSFAQYTVMAFTMFTIVYGCSRAVKETHIKRRLAYSTISNLSYILFGAALMTPAGLVGGLAHMVFHATMKICSFFCAGSVMYVTEKHYVHELDGIGKKMPGVMTIFTISAFALMGVPGLCGFISKYYLATAAVDSKDPMAYVGIACLLASALLTAIYMLSIVVRAFFPAKGFDYSVWDGIKDPGWKMMLPLTLFAIAMLVFGLYNEPLISFFTNIAAGLI
ncbi:MAG: proton-conducting membrane transporter [Lachnospiraceae bacterium]|nr:proton-conducting membrane transporter [Lachnospiraceae bacterium]